MYIHIGSSRMLRAEDIVGIFDLDGEVTTADTKEFLKNADKRGITALAGDDLYGGNCEDIQGQALHCGEISFPGEKKDEIIHLSSSPGENINYLFEKYNFTEI